MEPLASHITSTSVMHGYARRLLSSTAFLSVQSLLQLSGFIYRPLPSPNSALLSLTALSNSHSISLDFGLPLATPLECLLQNLTELPCCKADTFISSSNLRLKPRPPASKTSHCLRILSFRLYIIALHMLDCTPVHGGHISELALVSTPNSANTYSDGDMRKVVSPCFRQS